MECLVIAWNVLPSCISNLDFNDYKDIYIYIWEHIWEKGPIGN